MEQRLTNSPAGGQNFQPSCLVVVCTRNRPEKLERCLEAISRLMYATFQVLVVDNAPSDCRTNEIASRWKVRYIQEPIIGLSRARNLGAQNCDAEIIAYIDDDCLPHPDWLSGLVREFTNPSV